MCGYRHWPRMKKLVSVTRARHVGGARAYAEGQARGKKRWGGRGRSPIANREGTINLEDERIGMASEEE